MFVWRRRASLASAYCQRKWRRFSVTLSKRFKWSNVHMTFFGPTVHVKLICLQVLFLVLWPIKWSFKFEWKLLSRDVITWPSTCDLRWCNFVCYCVVKCRCAQVKWESASWWYCHEYSHSCGSEIGRLPEAGQSEEGGEFLRLSRKGQRLENNPASSAVRVHIH